MNWYGTIGDRFFQTLTPISENSLMTQFGVKKSKTGVPYRSHPNFNGFSPELVELQHGIGSSVRCICSI